ncbi:class I SAM-dependent methyltransferase [Hydrogenophaga sp. T2]|uniref:class I SAM-dependent methyltransferase n=1 Tax=Hydrogenophaga sp. T2 TaxID=3132823 RepID=UPI003CF01E00
MHAMSRSCPPSPSKPLVPRLPVRPAGERALHASLSPRISRELAEQRYDRQTGAVSTELVQRTSRNLATGKTPAVRLPDEDLVASLPPGAQAIDFGIADGQCLPAFLKRQVHVTGIDQDAAAITTLQRQWGQHPDAQRLRFVVGSGLRAAPFDDGAVDYVRLCNVLPYLSDAAVRETLQQARDLLRPSGRIFATLYHRAQTSEWGRRHSVAEALALAPDGLRCRLHGVHYEAYGRNQLPLPDGARHSSGFTGMRLDSTGGAGAVPAAQVDREIGLAARMLDEDGAEFLVIRVCLVLGRAGPVEDPVAFAEYRPH